MNKAIKVFKCESCGSFNEINSSNNVSIRQVPDGLEGFLINFTVSLLKRNPSSLAEMNNYALDYFQNSNLMFSNDSNQINQFNESKNYLLLFLKI